MNNKEATLFTKALKWIAKHSILPATMFNRFQINTIHKEFSRFWGIEYGDPSLKQPAHFSSFTLGSPSNLWAYYFPTMEEVQCLRNHYRLEPIQVLTEDGETLCGMHFQDHRSSSHPTPHTLIVFGGNGDLYKIGGCAWLLKLLKESPIPFNIVMFDPRDCGYSTGTAHPEGLVRDGEAIYQYVHKKLHVPENRIDLYGFSLGGAISTLVKAKHPATGGALINNRSFQTLDHAVKGLFAGLYAPFATFLGTLASSLRHHAGWDLNPLEAWKTITCPKMVICHAKDPIVPYCASLEQGLLENNLLTECQLIHLHQKNPLLNIRNHHVQPLSFYHDQHGQDAEEAFLHFLLRSNYSEHALSS